MSNYDDFVYARSAEYYELPTRHDMNLAEITYCALGIGGESGEIVDEVKKLWRGVDGDPLALALEIGDVLYYVTRLAKSLGYTLDELLQLNKVKLIHRDEHGKDKEGEYLVCKEVVIAWENNEKEITVLPEKR